MKNSQFNVFIRENENDDIIYNTLTGSIVKVSPELSDILKKYDNQINDNALITKLQEVGIVIDDEFDELEYYNQMHTDWKSGKETVSFNILFTYDCNFECPYCYQGRGEDANVIHGFKDMNKELLESVKEFIKRTTKERGAQKLELVLYGGEPFLVTDTCMQATDEIAGWCNSQGVTFVLHALSNGSLITEETVNWLSSHRCRIQIPVDGSKAMHDKYRFYKDTKIGSYEDIMKVLSLTKDTEIETHIRISLTDETTPTMEALLEDLKSRGLTHVYPDFCYITAFTEACTSFSQHCLDDDRIFRIMPELWEKALEKGFRLDIRPQVQPLSCSSVAVGSFIIDPFGNVYKCWEQVGLEQHVVGKINNDGSLTKTDVYYDVLERNPVNIDKCKTHSYLPACGGGCVCKAFWQKGTYHAPGCGTEIYLLKDKVKTYLKTLNLSDAEDFKQLQVIEGRQEPRISHCYVLV